MAIVLRYVKNGSIIEHFIGMVHVRDTTALSLKAAIDNVFSTHGLSISRLCGQGYDGASNMQGEFNVGASCKRRDMLREKQIVKVIEGLNNGELSSGQSLNQSTYLIRQGDTRWGSHYGTLMSLITMFSYVIDVLEIIEEDGFRSDQRDDSFLAFDKQKIIRFAEYYPKEFSTVKLRELDSQLTNYIIDVRSASTFEGLKGISTLAKKMVEAKKDKVYSLVYLLVTLALILPVATATVE
ncbi:uncharacterized protein LOC132281946 [Cornus florida]|uniref:uncharacterized protein LOC132281946 n=1 Tax=Cornus florida TaxID=4283 RepID=UPI00289ECCCF|nr:uncharacterized protein LOC132281946 [Cornus florida]